MFGLFGFQKSVKGQVVLITGGAMGIGRLMSLRFAKLGAIVIIWDLNTHLGGQVVDEIRTAGGDAHFYEMDVTDKERVYSVAESIVHQFGAVDILVNNAGIVGGKPILESNDRMIRKTFDVNVTSHFWTIKAFMPQMVKRNHGHIVSIASAAGLFGSGGMVDYGASKFAAVGLMMSLRQELQAMGKDGVHLTLVCPSFIKTGMFEGVAPPRFTTWLSPEYVADQIVRAVRRNQWKLVMPSLLTFLEMLMYIMPDWLAQFLVRFARVGHSMKTFKQTRPHALIKDSDEDLEKK
ncbi:Retinol dehydrogenase, partial [Globisporangium splendens]